MRRAWIPNALTLGNLTCGFVSVILSGTGSSEGLRVAAMLILVAALLDGVDGQAARLLAVDSPLGKELDSLADCVAFGVAPGYLAYKTYLSGLCVTLAGLPVDLAILLAAIFPVCAAYRLARFNIRSTPGSFSGLPLSGGGRARGARRPLLPPRVHPEAGLCSPFLSHGPAHGLDYPLFKATIRCLQNASMLRLAALAALVIILLLLFRFWVLLLADLRLRALRAFSDASFSSSRKSGIE